MDHQKRLLLSIVLLMCFAFAKAQLQSSQWFFGENAGIDFRSGTVTATSTSAMRTGEGCATISDDSGNLLFYTDGSTIYNRLNNVMINGSGLKGNSSSTSSAVVVPLPGSDQLFYVFTVDTDDLVYRNAEGMHYSIVNMELDSGNGAVQPDSKNTVVLPRTSEKLTAIENGTDTGFWVITQFEDKFYSFELTATGLNPTPVVSQADPFIELLDFPITNVDVAAMRGYIKVNSAGTRLAAAHFSNNSLEDFDGVTSVLNARSIAFAQGGELYLYDFNNNTGEISNPIPLLTKEDGGSYYGIEFSPDGNFLYAEVDYLQPSTFSIFNFIGGELAQFNLNAVDVAASKRTIYQDRNELFRGALQLGIDGKIYHARINQTALSVISNPNDSNIPVNYGFNELPLNAGTISVYGLPIFVQSFFQEFEIKIADACDGGLVIYSLETNTEEYLVVWDFGDSNLGPENSSTERSGSLVYSEPGTYEVTATVNTVFQEIVLQATVTVFPQIAINDVPLILTTCDLGQGNTFFELTGLINSVSAIESQLVEIFENEADALTQSNSINTSVPFESNQPETTLYIRIDNDNCFQIKEINLVLEKCPIEVFNALTPNGDQRNDTLATSNLRGTYDRFLISIFNRYGRLVWKGDESSDDWNGTANVPGTNVDLLPAGTYFYVIDVYDPIVKNPAGYIYLTY